MSTLDPLTLVRAVNPVDPASADQFAGSPVGREIFARILDDAVTTLEPERVATNRLPRRRVAALVLLGAVAIGAAAIVSRSPSDPTSAGCYQRPSQEANTAVIALGTEDRGAIEACAEVWVAAFGEPVPESLVTCVVIGGGLGVFPVDPQLSPDDACGAIGAAIPSEGDYAGLNGLEVRQLQAALRDRHDDLLADNEGCVSARRVIPTFDSTIDEQATQWRTVDASDASTCTDFVLDATAGHVVVIATPPGH